MPEATIEERCRDEMAKIIELAKQLKYFSERRRFLINLPLPELLDILLATARVGGESCKSVKMIRRTIEQKFEKDNSPCSKKTN